MEQEKTEGKDCLSPLEREGVRGALLPDNYVHIVRLLPESCSFEARTGLLRSAQWQPITEDSLCFLATGFLQPRSGQPRLDQKEFGEMIHILCRKAEGWYAVDAGLRIGV